MYEVYIEIEPEVCPYCHHDDNTRWIAGHVEDMFIEEYYCRNCQCYYHVAYEFANPRYLID